MKKKIIVAVALVLVLGISVGMLAGCDDIFSLNEERDAYQVVAHMTYNGQSADVYKFELKDSFNAYSYIYVNYYGMSYQQAADYVLRSLAQRELLVLFAKEIVSDSMEEFKDTPPELINVKDLLNNSEIDKAIKNANETITAMLESKVEEVIREKTTDSGSSSDEDDDDVETGDQEFSVRFESNKGSAVEKQTVKENAKATRPTDPTRDGYTFYGWYANADFTGDEFDFDTRITEKTVLYAKWIKHTDGRTPMPEAEEEDDYDADADIKDEDIAKKIFDDLDSVDFSDKDFAEDIAEADLKKYIEEAAKRVQSDLEKSFKSYDYYLQSEYETKLLERMEIVIGSGETVTEAEVEREFARLVAQNKETFANSSSAYESALTSALATTYYHKLNENGSYGFVANILLKLDDESVAKLTKMQKDGASEEVITAERNSMLGELTVKISNPDYESEEEGNYGKDENGDKITVRDPMTDSKNNHREQADAAAVNNLVSFEKDENGKWSIKFNATAYETMPYLYDANAEDGVYRHPAFSADGKVGIVNQIMASFDAITEQVGVEGGITEVESVYWLRKMSEAWLYIVGDDEGSVNSESNNGGLGYLVNPDKEKSTFITDFTNHAVALVNQGTGAYRLQGDALNEWKTTYGNAVSEDIAGGYIFADSFIESGSSDNAYAGIFVVMCTNTVWNGTTKGLEKDADGNYNEVDITFGEDGILPLNFVLTYGETLEDCVTVYDKIYEQLLEGKKTDVYNQRANAFGLEYTKNIQYNEKAYKSLWKDLD